MALSEPARKIKQHFAEHQVTLPVSDLMYEQFAKFYKFLMDYQKKYNLTRLTTFDEVAIKHFVDCVYALQVLEGQKLPDPIIDMGSGAGFPGIPLKIVSPQTRIILVEGVQKKVEYLKELRGHLGLQRLDIIGRNVEPKMQYPVQGLMTRAVETTVATLKNAINCVQVGGLVILMKTPGIDSEIEEAQKEMGQVYELVQNSDYRLGRGSHERKLLVYKKIRKASEVGLG